MATKTMYLAGTGGQGLQVLGKTIAEAANDKGYYVTYSPKYGSAKRGGLTSCYVVISTNPIGNPRKKLQDLLLVMEPKAYMQFRSDLKPGGTLVVNSTLIPNQDEPAPGTKRVDVPLHGVCADLGNTKVISSVALGAMAVLLDDLFPDQNELLDCMLRKLASKPELADLNRKAYKAGFSAMTESMK